MVFPNLYYKRTAATAKACFICYKPTTTVLATIDTADFLYTCPIHLTDRGFATRVLEPEPEPKKPSASPAEIAKVKQEWEEKQRQKKDKGKDKDKAAEETQGDEDGKDDKTDGTKKDVKEKEVDARVNTENQQEKKLSSMSSPPPEESTIRPTHDRYVLHRDIFALRTADHRRRRQTAQAKDLAPRLPGAPKGSVA